MNKRTILDILNHSSPPVSPQILTPHDLSTMPFLDLPAELRLSVYGYLCNIHTTPFAACQGLYLSCRSIKAEIDSEGARITGADLADIQSRLLVSSFDMPTSFSVMHHVRLIMERRARDDRGPVFHDLKLMLGIHATSLMVSIHEDDGYRGYFDLEVLFALFCGYHENRAEAKCVVLGLPVADNWRTGKWVGLMGLYRVKSKKYIYRWEVQSGECVKAVWEVGGWKETLSFNEVFRALQGL
jgi:hypothetical protein